MHQIESALRKWIHGNVVAPHFEVARPWCFEEPGINVSRQHTSGGPHMICKPSRDGSTPTPNFQAGPAIPDAALFQMMNRDFVKQFGKGSKSRGRLWAPVGQQVTTAQHCLR